MNSLNKELESSKIRLSDTEFKKLSSFIYANFGIKLPPIKKVLLEGRLQKRLKATQLNSFKDYLDYIFSKEGESEIIHMIDQVSTNKTDFFREPDHFDFFNNHNFHSSIPFSAWFSGDYN